MKKMQDDHEFEEAAVVIEKPENNYPFIKRMKKMQDDHEFEEAAVMIENKLTLIYHPHNAQGCLYSLAKCYFSLQKYSKVIKAYKELDSYKIGYLTHGMYASVGCKIKEIADLLKTQEFYGKKEELDEISVLLKCDVDQVYNKLLNFSLFVLKPVSKHKSDIKSEWTLCIIGDIYLQKNKLEKARAYYEKGLKVKSDDFYLRKSYGDYFLKTGDNERAETEYNLALQYFDQCVKNLNDVKMSMAKKIKDEAEANLKII